MKGEEECTCAWNPVAGWVVCQACCSADNPCTHLMEELEGEGGE